jgi:hypothetical protein
MPEEFKKTKLKTGELLVLYSHQLMALQWIDRKPVNMLSTFHQDLEMTPTGKTDRKTKYSNSQT